MYLATQNNTITDVHFYDSGMAQHPVHDGSAPAAYTSRRTLHHYVFIGTMTMDSFAALDAIDQRVRTIATMLYLAGDDALISRRSWY